MQYSSAPQPTARGALLNSRAMAIQKLAMNTPRGELRNMIDRQKAQRAKAPDVMSDYTTGARMNVRDMLAQQQGKKEGIYQAGLDTLKKDPSQWMRDGAMPTTNPFTPKPAPVAGGGGHKSPFTGPLKTTLTAGASANLGNLTDLGPIPPSAVGNTDPYSGLSPEVATQKRIADAAAATGEGFFPATHRFVSETTPQVMGALGAGIVDNVLSPADTALGKFFQETLMRPLSLATAERNKLKRIQNEIKNAKTKEARIKILKREAEDKKNSEAIRSEWRRQYELLTKDNSATSDVKKELESSMGPSSSMAIIGNPSGRSGFPFMDFAR